MYKKKKLKKWVRYSLLGVVIILFLSATLMVTSSIQYGNKKSENILYSYHISQDLDYKVNLYKNSFIDSEYLEKGQSYISDLIKSIDVNFGFNYSGSKKVDLEYEYYVTGNVHGEYQLKDDVSDTKIWTKKYQLLEKTKGKINEGSQFNINENVNIDFNYYNDVVAEFRKELKLSIDSNFIVTFTIDINGTVEDEQIKDTREITMIIPLNQQAFKITEKYDQEINENILKKKEYVESVDYKRLISGIIVGIMSIALFIVMFREIFNIPKKTYYAIQKNKILKEYGDIIVEILSPISKEDMTLIIVKDFNEMIDLEEELRIPIMFFEPYEEYGEFILVHDNIIYQYLLTNEQN